MEAITCGLALLLASPAADAAPVTGEGRAAAGEAQQGAWRAALEQARRAALEQALDGVGLPVSPEVRAQVLDRELESWTASYRILEQAQEGDTFRLRIQVEIDLGRLTKRLTPAAAGPRPRTLGPIVARGACSERGPEVQALRTALLGGLGGIEAAKGPGEIRGELTCTDLGPVPLAGVEVSRVQVRLRTPAGPVAASAVAAGVGAPQARAAAVAQAAVDLLPRVRAGASVDAVVRVVGPVPARAVRHLVRALGRSVPGVRRAELRAVGRGAVDIGLRTELSPGQLADRLAALRFPDFALRIQGTDGAAVTLRVE